MSKSRDIADSAATINYIDGLTSDAQSQLDDKATLDGSPTFTGTVTATAFSGDGSGLTGVDSLPSQTGNAGEFLTTDGTNPSWTPLSTSPTLEAIASGSLGDGDTVIINADGTVSVVSESTVESFDSGSEVDYGISNHTNERSITYDPANNKIIIVYRDTVANIIAQVGTVSGLNISFGSAVTVRAATGTQSACVYDPNTQKIIISYRYNSQNSSRARVGTVSGNTISFGTEANFDGNTTFQSMVYHAAEQKVVISYVDEGNSNFGTSIVGTVSGTTISFGSPVVFNSATTSFVDSVYDPDSEKVIITYRNGATNITAIVGTVSGTSISFGTPAVTGDAGTTIDYGKIAYDATAQKVVMVGMVAANGGGRCYVGTVSGTSISFSTPIYFSAVQYGYYPDIVYDSVAQKCVVVSGASVAGTANAYLITITGNTPTASSPYQFASSYIDDLKIAYDSNSGVSVIHGRNGVDGSVFVIQAAEIATNLTSENYIGISDGAYADTATATILVDGSVSEAQTGLTAGQDYYIQGDGSLALTPVVPSVLAGTATSATNLLIRTNKDSLPVQTSNAGKFLTTDGSTASWAKAGSLELISTTTVSGTPSTIDVTSGFSSTYDDYVIYAADLAGSATAVIRIQVYTGGTLEAGANYSYVRNNQGSTWTVETSREYIEASVLSTNTGGFKAEIFDSNNTVANNSFLCAYGRNRTALSGQWNSSGAVTGFRLLLSTGTFVSGGTIRLYGIKKSQEINNGQNKNG